MPDKKLSNLKKDLPAPKSCELDCLGEILNRASVKLDLSSIAWIR